MSGFAGAFLAFGLATAPPAAGQAAPPSASGAASFSADIRPLLEKHCIECHGPKKQKGNLNLDAFAGEAAVLKDRKTWKKAWDKVYGREMPPEEHKPRMPQSERDRLTGWIESVLGRIEGGTARDPGRVVLRRLNRVEYRSTIRDLVGVDAPVQDFPSDDVGYGFDNIGDVLSLPPLLLEKYFGAAEQVLDAAIVTDVRNGPEARHVEAETLVATGGAADGAFNLLAGGGEIAQDVTLAKDGPYVLRLRGWGNTAGAGRPVTLALRVDGAEVKRLEVKATKNTPAVFEAPAALKAGKRRVAAAFVDDAKGPSPKGRVLAVDWIEVVGPTDAPPQVLPESHKRIFIASPEKDRRKAARDVLSAFAARAWRRPPAGDELDRLAKAVDAADKRGASFEASVACGLEAVLVSPNFIFRVEPDRTGDDPKGVRPVDDWELASRLSYFVWSTMPDAELFDHARKSDLHAPRVLEAQVRRMLADPKASSLAENFAVQWLQLRRLDAATPDRKLFPAWDDALRDAMKREAVLFFESVLREDRGVMTLLDADYTFVNGPLARHYGIAGVDGPEFRRVTLPDRRRGGVLTMAGVLTVTSNAQRTSPVKRGKWVMEAILASPPPPPLPGVDSLKENAPGGEKLTVRQRLEQHRADPNCAACHGRLDPIGFGFENFDAVGAWRESDEGRPIDCAAALPDGRAFSGPVELRALLVSRKDEFVRCLAEKMLTYALGRGIEACDAPTVREIATGLSSDGDRFSRLVVGIATSYPFLHRRNRAAGGTGEEKRP